MRINPYAPRGSQPARPVPPPAPDPAEIPLARLRRLGLAEDRFALIQDQWDRMSREDRINANEWLADLTDDEARAQLAGDEDPEPEPTPAKPKRAPRKKAAEAG